jgi:hypothetical protein
MLSTARTPASVFRFQIVFICQALFVLTVNLGGYPHTRQLFGHSCARFV